MRKLLVSYSSPKGIGRFFNSRPDDSLPTEEDILSMEAQLSATHGGQVAITGFVELALPAAESASE